MNQKPVIVRTPMSRRRVLVVAGGAAAVVGALKLVTWAGRPTDEPRRLSAHVLNLAVAIPTGGDARDPYTNQPLLAAVNRVLPDVEQAGQGRFRLTVQEVAQPAAPKPPAAPTPQIVVLGPLMASGAPPDLLALTSYASPGALPSEFALILDSRALLPLDDLWKGSAPLTLGDFYPPALEVCRQQGKLLGVPLMAAPLLLAYDERRFRSASVNPPDDTWGWPQLLDAARRLTHTTGGANGGAPSHGVPDQYGLVPYPTIASLLALIWQNGGDVISADKTQALLTDPRAREAIEYFGAFYADQPASPPDTFTSWVWNGDGVRADSRWWAAMTQAPAPVGFARSTFPPPVPNATDLLKQMFGEWFDDVRDAFDSPPVFRSPMQFAPLPRGRQRATALGVTATLSVSHKASDPDAAAMALALVAERVSKSVVPSARRLPTDVMLRLAPHYTPGQIQLLADSLADSRILVASDLPRTKQLHLAVWNSLFLPIQHRSTRPLDDIVESANRAVQAVLNGP